MVTTELFVVVNVVFDFDVLVLHPTELGVTLDDFGGLTPEEFVSVFNEDGKLLPHEVLAETDEADWLFPQVRVTVFVEVGLLISH